MLELSFGREALLSPAWPLISLLLQQRTSALKPVAFKPFPLCSNLQQEPLERGDTAPDLQLCLLLSPFGGAKFQIFYNNIPGILRRRRKTSAKDENLHHHQLGKRILLYQQVGSPRIFKLFFQA